MAQIYDTSESAQYPGSWYVLVYPGSWYILCPGIDCLYINCVSSHTQCWMLIAPRSHDIRSISF